MTLGYRLVGALREGHLTLVTSRMGRLCRGTKVGTIAAYSQEDR